MGNAGMGYDVGAAEEWLDSWTASISARAEQTARLSRNVAALTGTARSADGSIRVSVGSAGQVESLDLADRVQGISGSELARQIMAVMRRAQADLVAKVATEVEATLGADTETGRAVIGSFESRFPRQDDEPADGAGDGHVR